MDPNAITPAQWSLIQRSLVELVLFAAASLAAAGAFTAGRAIVPSLRGTGEIPSSLARYVPYARWGAYAAAAVLVALAAWLCLHALGAATAVLRNVYPRFVI
jgi:hypothetical protein